MEKVYIIIINFKNHIDTVECLESCLKLEYSDFQIIVIDNSPSYESYNYIKDWAKGDIRHVPSLKKDLVYPLVKKPISTSLLTEEMIDNNIDNKHNDKLLLIKAKENKGFGAANNIGIKYINSRNDYKFVWLLNNDTIVEKETLNNLIDCFKIDSQKKIGLMGCTLLHYSYPNEVQGIGGAYNPWLGSTKHIGEGLTFEIIEQNFFDLQNKLDYIIGASIFTSRKFIKEVGFLSEDYFLYFEELDWRERGKEFGYEIATCLAKVYHK